MKTSNTDVMRSMEHSGEADLNQTTKQKKIPIMLYGGSTASSGRQPGPGTYNLVAGDIIYEARQGKGTTLKGRNFIGVNKVEDFPGPAAYDTSKLLNRS